MKNLNGFYRGIVVQNNDPLRLGRVKVFIPHLHMSLLELEDTDFDKEIYFSEFGTNYNEFDENLIDLTKYIAKIKFRLPWAEISMPITGAGYSSFNSSSKTATTSDSPYLSNQKQDVDGSTGAPAGAIEQSYPPKDKFSASTDNPNPLGSSYFAQSFYNSPKGMFGIPQVNTKVWLFFLDGNPNNPIVFGCSPSPNTYNQMYDDTTYPSGYENNDELDNINPEDFKKQTRTVMNYAGGSLTFDGTNNNEELSLSHDSGSFSKFSNSGQSNLVIGQKQSLIKGDNFSTIEGAQSYYCAEKMDQVIGGDLNISIGSLNYSAGQRWKDAAAKIHAVKSLPEIQNSDNSSVFSSPLAKKSGINPPCRACSKGEKRKTFKGEEGVGSKKNLNSFEKSLETISGFLANLKSDFLKFLDNVVDLNIEGITEEQYPKTPDCPVCKGSGISPSTMDGEFPPEARKKEIGNLYLESAQEFFETENETSGDVTATIAGDVFLSIGTATNDFDSIRINKSGSENTIGVELDPEMGLYSAPVTSSTVEMNHVDKFPGGQFTIDAGNGIALYGGSAGCEMSSTGPLTLYGTVTEVDGEQVNINSKSGMSISTSEVLTLNAANISIEASGQTCLKGNIAFDGNLMCTGGTMVQGELYVQHMTGPMEDQLTDFQPETYGKPNTSEALKMGFIKTGEILQLNISGLGSVSCVVEAPIPVMTMDGEQMPDDDCIIMPPHQHVFRNIPMTLTGTYGESRSNALSAGMNGREPVQASKIENGLKAPNVPYMAPLSAFGTTQKSLTAIKIVPLKMSVEPRQ